jgi:HEPN domain-containing protein
METEKSNIDIDKVYRHWLETSKEDFETMMSLYLAKSYHWALFLGHISVEKLLKAYYVKKMGKHAPFTHNLYRLAELSEIELTEEQANILDKITTFNLNARYDDYKREFYQLCTKEFTEKWIENIKQTIKWIEQKL